MTTIERIFFVVVVIVCLSMKIIDSLTIDQYSPQSIGDLFVNETFLIEFEKQIWKLYEEKDYFFGQQISPFPCSTIDENPDRFRSMKTVHQLTPFDIQCVAAIGDSLTAGLGAHAATPIGLFTEYRGFHLLFALIHSIIFIIFISID